MPLVIGYGNPLRSDDGIGPRVAEAVRGWQHPDWRAIACHQLLPELAPELARTDLALFVDAVDAADEPGVEMRPLRPEPGDRSQTHHCDPASLLYLTRELYGASPTAYWLLVPGHCWDWGEQLSPRAEEGMAQCLWMLESWQEELAHA